jgi:hypothetical protein
VRIVSRTPAPEGTVVNADGEITVPDSAQVTDRSDPDKVRVIEHAEIISVSFVTDPIDGFSWIETVVEIPDSDPAAETIASKGGDYSIGFDRD